MSSRLLRPRQRRRSWRSRHAAGPDLWPDVALAAALGAVVVWMTARAVHAASGAPYDTDFPVDLPPDLRLLGFDPDRSQIVRDGVLDLLITSALVARRRLPLACFAAQIFVLLGFDVDGNVVMFGAALLGAYSVAAYGRRAAYSAGLLTVVALLIATVKTNTWPRLPGWAGIFALLAPVALAGFALRAARERAQVSEERAAAVHREQETATRLAVAGERARIARELHDVVSHHVSVMTIQAGAAGKVLDANPELARGALTAIENSGRQTMAELRHLLGVLTPEPDPEPALAAGPLCPQPGLGQLDTLVEGVRRAGQPVSVRRVPTALPAGLDLTVYRVVQEALTNALRYAPGARTIVDIGVEPPADASPAGGGTVDTGRIGTGGIGFGGVGPGGCGAWPRLVIEVTNDAPPPIAHLDAVPSVSSVPSGAGAGLVGLGERLRLYGGTLEASRRLGGGFRVLAQLPLEAAR